MKNNYTKNIILFTLILLIVSSPSAFAFNLFKKKVKTPPAPTKYEKLFKNKTVKSDKGGLMALHIVNGKLLVELPLDKLGKPMILASSVSSTGNPSYCVAGQHANDPIQLHFEKQDSTIVMYRYASDYITEKKDIRSEQIIEQYYKDPIMARYDIKAYNSDSTAVVLDMSDLFMGKVGDMSPLWKGGGLIFVRSSSESKLARFTDVKSLSDNIVVKSSMQYKMNVFFIIFPILKNSPVPVDATFSLIQLPESEMQLTPSDKRMNLMTVNKNIIPSNGRAIKNEDFACRWDIAPEDMKQWESGQMTKVKKPIIMYLDPLFPDSWKQPIISGVTRWNDAFEAIGLEDAIIVKDFPSDDPEFDPDNYKYSCIRYAPSSNESTFAHSWANPTTGEIFAGNIVLHANMAGKYNKIRFVQTAMVDPSVRTTMPSDEVFALTLENIAARTMGQVLGLTMNLAASSAYPVDSLRSASFTKQYGITPSIMDNVRYNYVAQQDDKDVVMVQTNLGPYDYMAIKWLYSPELQSMKGNNLDEKIIKSIGDVPYKFAIKEGNMIYDPVASENDLGDDQIKASDYAINNLKATVANLPKWFNGDNDPDGSYRAKIMAQIDEQFQYYVINVINNIGAFDLNETISNKVVAKEYKAMDAQTQRNSVKWVIKQIRESGWINSPEVYSVIGLKMPSGYSISNVMVGKLNKAVEKVTLCASLSDDPYTVEQYYTDLFDGLWEPAIENKPLTLTDKIMHKRFLNQSKSDMFYMAGLSSSAKPTLPTSLSMQMHATAMEDLTELEDLTEGVIYKNISLPLLQRTQQYQLEQLRALLPIISARAKSGVKEDRAHYKVVEHMITNILKMQ